MGATDAFQPFCFSYLCMDSAGVSLPTRAPCRLQFLHVNEDITRMMKDDRR
jgi:hypothetical protein